MTIPYFAHTLVDRDDHVALHVPLDVLDGQLVALILDKIGSIRTDVVEQYLNTHACWDGTHILLY